MKTKPADMPEDASKTLPVTSNNELCSSKKVIKNQCKKINHGCKYGAASCENCPVAFEMKMGADRDAGHRNVFSYLRIVAVILILTFIVKGALTLLSV